MISLCNLKGKFIISFLIFNVCQIRVRAGSDKIYFPEEPTIPIEAETQETTNAASTSTAISVNDLYDDNERYTPYDAGDHFSWKFLKNVLKNKKPNVVVSPFSVKVSLSMLAEAAGDNTKTQRELLEALEVTEIQENLRVYYKDTLNLLRKQNPFLTLNLETKLFTDQSVEPEQRYATLLSEFYGTDIERLKFENAPASAERINSWCENVTNGKLRNLVTKENVQNSVLMLVNAIYFKAVWSKKFQTTYDGLFFTAPETTRAVQYMENIDLFYYYDDSLMDARIIRLPYGGKQYSMFILLPKTKVGVEELIKDLEGVKRMQSLMKPTKVKIIVPKFKFEYQEDLENTFSHLGINDIFTDDASLPGLDGSAHQRGTLKVSSVIQKAGIGINENGTEAFAATEFDFIDKMDISGPPKEFTVDRPFIFFIEEDSTDSIIFAGKVLDPAL